MTVTPQTRQRILVISSCFHPDRGGGSAVNTDLCLGLAARGMDITVWTAYPHYPEWTDKSGNNGFRVREEQLGGLTIRRYGLFIPWRAGSLWQRLFYEATFLMSLLRNLFAMRRYDAIMAFCPQVASLAAGALGAMLFRKPLWLNVQDLAAEAAAAGGIVKSGVLSRILKGTQAWLFNRAVIWSTISPVMVRRLEGLRRRNQRILYLPNWLNESLELEIQRLPSKLGRPVQSPLRLLYAGNFGKKQNLTALLNALSACKTSFQFQLYGNGGDERAVQEWFEKNTDARFSLGPFLDEVAFARALNECDLFVLPEISGSGASFLPSKLMAVYASATPVLCISDPDSPLGHEVRESHCGPTISWHNIHELDGILRYTEQHADAVTKWQTQSRHRAAVFDRTNIVCSFERELSQLLSPDSASAQSTLAQR